MDVVTSFQPQGLVQWALCSTAVGIVLLVSLLVFNSKIAGLSHIPGPFWARYTDVWAVYFAWATIRYQNKVKEQRSLQSLYGDVVRTGPWTVTVFDPAAVPLIYGVRTKLEKVSKLCILVERIDKARDRGLPMSRSGKLASRPVF